MKPLNKIERSPHVHPALWSAGGRSQFLVRKKRRDGERNQVTETNFTWAQLLFLKPSLCPTVVLQGKRFRRVCIYTYIYDNPPSPMQETKHARLRERTQIIYYITGLGLTQCRWMNVTLKTINARISAAQAHLTHAHQN